MKKLLALAVLAISLPSIAGIIIQEEVYVIGRSPEVVKELLRVGSVEIDHVTSEGFELYGSAGLMRYLDSKKIVYNNMKLARKRLDEYPKHDEIIRRLLAAQAKRPDIISVFPIGKSVKGRDLVMVKISDNVKVDEVEPEFKYISSMHGDEITGREMTVALVHEIADKYGRDPEITALVNNTEIFIMPSMNPDGSELKQRANANGFDLNRNFPDITNDPQNSPAGRQPETQVVMAFQASRQFALSANFHGGTIVANYPWDSKYDQFPLEGLVKDLSIGYSNLNPDMRNSTEFPGGITNGARWYIVRNGMQDWSYLWFNDLQITLEVSHIKYPPYAEIAGHYRNNRDSMIYLMKQIHRGAGFKIKRPGLNGVVNVKRTYPAPQNLGNFAFKGSEFYKVLPEGEYTFTLLEKKVRKSFAIDVRVERDVIRPNGNYKIID